MTGYIICGLICMTIGATLGMMTACLMMVAGDEERKD